MINIGPQRMHLPRSEHSGSSGRVKSPKNSPSEQIEHGSLSPKMWGNESRFSVSDKENILDGLRRAQAGTNNVAKVINRDVKTRSAFNVVKAESAFRGISENLGRHVSELRAKKAPKALIDETAALQTSYSRNRSLSESPVEYLNKIQTLSQSIDLIYKKAASLKSKV